MHLNFLLYICPKESYKIKNPIAYQMKLDQFYKDQNDLYFTNYQKAAIENGQLKNIIEHNSHIQQP